MYVDKKSTKKGGEQVLTDTMEMELSITRANITKREIAKRLGISETALYHKLNNTVEFKASEIVKMKEMLHLTDKQRDKIFFA